MEFNILTKFSPGNIKTLLLSEVLKLNIIQLLVRDCLLLLPLIGNGFVMNKVFAFLEDFCVHKKKLCCASFGLWGYFFELSSMCSFLPALTISVVSTASCKTCEFYHGGHIHTSMQLTDSFPTISGDSHKD